ncbi:MAG: hypothetical protein ACRBCT_02535 [Alphaproteobacteria bacterium]
MSGYPNPIFANWRVWAVVGLLFAIFLLSTTFVLAIGMLPTIVAVFVDTTPRKSKVLAVGAMNLAGCFPFLLELWTGGNDFERAFRLVTDPKAIIVMYAAAAAGYVISWALTGAVAAFLVQKAKMRLSAIEKRQKELVERWGKDVSGEVALDEDGFRIEVKD